MWVVFNNILLHIRSHRTDNIVQTFSSKNHGTSRKTIIMQKNEHRLSRARDREELAENINMSCNSWRYCKINVLNVNVKVWPSANSLTYDACNPLSNATQLHWA